MELYRRHIAALAACDGSERCEYIVGTWGPIGEHAAILEEYRSAFSAMRLIPVSDEPYFPLPQAYNAALANATCWRCVVVGADVVVPPNTIEWALSRTEPDVAWIAGCTNSEDGRQFIGADQPGMWPFCMACATDALRNIGGWDTALSDGVVFDDVDLGLRLIASGVTFRWDFAQNVVHQSHPRAHGRDRGRHAERNKRLVESRLGVSHMQDVWPCWWRELYTRQPRTYPEGDGIPEQEALRERLHECGYPLKAP